MTIRLANGAQGTKFKLISEATANAPATYISDFTDNLVGSEVKVTVFTRMNARKGKRTDTVRVVAPVIANRIDERSGTSKVIRNDFATMKLSYHALQTRESRDAYIDTCIAALKVLKTRGDVGTGSNSPSDVAV